MPSLSEYSNVYNTALLILKEKGFSLWEESGLYCAEKDGWDFKADTPCGLLGIISIFEHKKPIKYKEGWWKVCGEELYNNLPTEAPDYKPVWKK